jgi:GNAT superfamily N-acetyltransferase
MRAAFETPAGRVGDRVDLEFSGEIWEWRGPAPYYFVTVPEEPSAELKAASAGTSYHRGKLRVQARIGDTEWPTSMWPKDGRYLVPIRDSVRKPRGLADGDTVTIHLTVAVPALDKRQNPARARPARANRQAPQAAGRRQPRSRDDQRVGRSGAGVVEGRTSPQVTDDQLRIVPANEATWEDLQAIFGVRAICWCQRYKMQPREGCIYGAGAAKLAPRLREQTACGQPDSATTTGLVAYLDGEPVGWCAVDPRSANPRLLSQCPTPWVGRAEDKTDASVWAVTCFVTRAGYRRRGISRALARAAVDFARQRGARALEGYPHTREVGHFGTPSLFAAAGLVEVSRPSLRRRVMRIDF